MHLRATGEKLDISEGYWTLWYWFEELTRGELRLGDLSQSRTIQEGGVWGVAAELAVRYGWMREDAFKPGARNLSKAFWHKEAVTALNASLTHGLLADPEVRANPTQVFDELAHAWQLEPGLASDLKRVFLGGKRLNTGADPSGTFIRRAAELDLLTDESPSTLADVLGEMTPGTTPYDGQRTGPRAWSEVYYQFDRQGVEFQRNVQRNIQDTLHKHLPVPIAWLWRKHAKGSMQVNPATTVRRTSL